MSDYVKIASAIEFIRKNMHRQPTLDDIAAHSHLSIFHFQRLFSRWAGVTPKRFLQILTLERAKSLLQDSQHSSLDVTYALGLSSGSRLYDHFVQLEAVTPAEYKRQGRGLRFVYGYHETLFGWVFIALTSRGICALNFAASADDTQFLSRLQAQWPHADLREDPQQTCAVINTLFANPAPNAAPISLWVKGTNFQINVWKALLDIQCGQVSSYRDIAHAVGRPKAARAVGTAIGANPVGFIIPCHRVLRQTGALGGYRWGETRKHAMLVREMALHEESSL